MVYLHFPSNLTEEELMLQAKYQKLKKKKKALQALKAPKQEPEKPILPKRPTEARDAREIARKLIKSGAIQAIKSPPAQPQNATFKRPRAGRERKLSGSTGSAGGVASYQPFSASQEPPPPEEKASPRVKYLYDSFVTSREKEEKSTRNQAPGEVPNSNGKTTSLQIVGSKITEELLRRRLASFEPFTFTQEPEDDKLKIMDIEHKINQNGQGFELATSRKPIMIHEVSQRVYLTFETTDMATHAHSALDGCEEGWRTTYVKKVPQPAGSWTPAPSTPRNTQPAPQKDAKRTLLIYDDIFE